MSSDSDSDGDGEAKTSRKGRPSSGRALTEGRGKDRDTSNGSSASMNRYSLSKLNQSGSLSKSITFDFDKFDGDYLKVTVKKESENKPGLVIEKTEGKFLIKKVPIQERRLFPGMQVLAVNGVVNLHTMSKVEDLISRTSGEIELILDFTAPLTCPSCFKPMQTNGKKTAGSRIIRMNRKDDVSVSDSVEISVAASEITTKIGNQAPPSQRVARIPERRAKYKLGDFDSDSDDDDDDSESDSDEDSDSDDNGGLDTSTRSATRGSVSRYKANDKFMIRVSKKGKNKPQGLELFDHRGVIYVSKVLKKGLFYATPIMEGDKVLSVNGRKAAAVKNAVNAQNIMAEKDAISLFVLRPDPNDRHLKEAMARFP